MRKMYNLLINEYIKIFSKISTIIMIALIILLALLYNLAMNYSNRGYDDAMEEGDMYEQWIQEEQNTKNEGWKVRIEQYRFMKEQKIAEDGNWKQSAAYTAFERKASFSSITDKEEAENVGKSFETIKQAIVADDWKAYINEEIRWLQGSNEVSAEDKEIQLFSLKYRIQNGVSPSYSGEDGWKNNVLTDLEVRKREYNDEVKKPASEQDEKRMKNIQNAILIGVYRLENNIRVFTMQNEEDEGNYGSNSEMGKVDFWLVFSNSILLISVVSLLIIIVAGNMVSTEFSNGTIKFLLINPIKRWKIIVSKYIAVISVGLLMLLIYYIFNAILAGVFFGFEDIGAPYLFVSDGVVCQGSSFLFVAEKYLIGSVGLLTMATFAFCISSLVRNSALSIGLGVFLMLSGNGAIAFLGGEMGIDWTRYLIFANTDINAILLKSTPFVGHTVSFALTIIVIYMVVFLLTAWDGFVRRDIR